MRKHVVLIAFFGALTAATAAAGPVFQMTLYGAGEFSENPDTVKDMSAPFRERSQEQTDLYNGAALELTFGGVGIGARYGTRFTSFDVPAELGVDQDVDWWHDWKTDLYVSGHLFGGGAFIDPYVQFGVGTAGRAHLEEDVYFDEDGTWNRYEEGESDSYQLTNLSMYQYIGTGAQVNVSGVLIGAGLNYHIFNQHLDAPEENWGTYPLQRFEVRIYGGVSFGRSRWR